MFTSYGAQLWGNTLHHQHPRPRGSSTCSCISSARAEAARACDSCQLGEDLGGRGQVVAKKNGDAARKTMGKLWENMGCFCLFLGSVVPRKHGKIWTHMRKCGKNTGKTMVFFRVLTHSYWKIDEHYGILLGAYRYYWIILDM